MISEQMEFKFFWPLTEQIPLDLDYTHCNTRQDNGYTLPSNGYGFHPIEYTWSSAVTSTVRIDSGDIDGYMKIGNLEIGQKKPNIIRKLLYKLLGFNWKSKP